MQATGIRIFNMADNEEILRCRKYREALERNGYRTILKHCWLDLFKVVVFESEPAERETK